MLSLRFGLWLTTASLTSNVKLPPPRVTVECADARVRQLQWDLTEVAGLSPRRR